jgi:hypothetical protein
MNNYNSFMVLQSKDHYNYSTHKVFCVFTSHCLVMVSNSGDSSVFVLENHRWMVPASDIHIHPFY